LFERGKDTEKILEAGNQRRRLAAPLFHDFEEFVSYDWGKLSN